MIYVHVNWVLSLKCYVPVPSCNHINMAVNVAAMRKGLLKQVYGECAVSSSYCHIVYREKTKWYRQLQVAVLYKFCNFQEIVFYHVAVLYTNFTFSLVPMRPRSVEREKPALGLRPPPRSWRQNPPSGCVCSVVTRWGSQQLDPYIVKLILFCISAVLTENFPDDMWIHLQSFQISEIFYPFSVSSKSLFFGIFYVS